MPEEAVRQELTVGPRRFATVYRPELEGGYSALCPELGVASQGETVEEAEANLREAVELYLELEKELESKERVRR